MNYIPCLLVIFCFTIVHGTEYSTTPFVPGGIAGNNDKTTIIDSITTISTDRPNNVSNDPLIGLFKNALKQQSSNDDDIDSSTNIGLSTDHESISTTTASTSTVTTNIQMVPKRKVVPTNPTTTLGKLVQQPPRKRLSTLPPLATFSSPAALNNSLLLQGWIADEISDALWAFAPQPSDNPKCTLHGQLYRNSINNFTLWAMQMLDSSNRIPSGLLAGSVFQLGHFDECIKVQVPGEDLDGKYCLTTIEFAPKPELYPHFEHDTNPKFYEPEIYEPAWEYFEPNNDVSRRPRNKIHWAVCVPSSCTTEDIYEGLKDALIEPLGRHGVSINVSLPDNKCYTPREEPSFSIGLYVTIGILVTLYLIVVFATWMDMFYYQSGRDHSKSLRKWVKPFSAYTNLSKLTKPNPNKEFAEFHYLKAFAMTCVISGHRQMSLHGPTPNENPWWLEWTYSQFIVAFSVNGGVLVDTFFFLSGFLTCHYIYQELIKRKRLNLLAIIINRWIRIAPIYMFVMAIYGWVLPYTGDGPLWKSRIGLESARCVESWWINLLFLNNYINVENQCMTQAWYLACDMHFFIVGSLLVYALWKWPKAGEYLLWFALFVACAIPGYVTYKNRYWGVVLHYNSLFIDPVSTEQFRNIYMTSHNRFGPYVVGIIGAYLYHKLQKRNYKFSVPVMIIGSLIGAGLSFFAILGGYIFYIRDRPYNIVESVLYAATHRAIWSVGIIWFLVVDATTGYGILYNFFKHPFFTPFGRLTYCAYLVHMIPQMIHSSTSRLPIYLDLKRMFWYTMGDFAMTYSIALALNLLFEAPLERLQKKILKKLIASHDAKEKLNQEKKFNGELNEVHGIENQAMDKADIA